MDAVVDNKARTGWQHELYDLLRRHGITQFAYDAEVKKTFGLSATDAIVAVLYIGSVGHPGKPRRVDLDTVIMRW